MTPLSIALIAIPCLTAFAGMVWWFFNGPCVPPGADDERDAWRITPVEGSRFQ